MKPRRRHEKADPAVQEAFKKNLPDKLEAIAPAHPDKRIEPWFEDEARFGQQRTLARVWARRGSRPRAVKQTGYEWLYVSAAVCPASGESVGLLSPYMDDQIVSILLRQLSQHLPDDVQAVLLGDQAGFHKCKALLLESLWRIGYASMLRLSIVATTYFSEDSCLTRLCDSLSGVDRRLAQAWVAFYGADLKAVSRRR